MMLRLTTVPFLLLLLGLPAGGHAQQAEDQAGPDKPDISSLQGDWWSYFEGPPAESGPRIAAFLDGLRAEIAELAPRNQPSAESTLEAVRENVDAYLALLVSPDLRHEELPEPAASYSIEDLLRLAAVAREAEAAAADEQATVDREQRIFDSLTRRRVAAFKSYVDAQAGDERWLAGLRLLLARSALAISERRRELLTQSYERARAYSDATAERVDIAMGRLAAVDDAAVREKLEQRISALETAVASGEDELRAAEIAASGLDLDTAQGRSQQQLRQQGLVGAEIDLRLAEVELAQSEAARWWTDLYLGAATQDDTLEEKLLDWSQLARDTEQQAPEWQRATEDELLAVQSTNREGLDRASRRLLDQRLSTAQQALADAARLGAEIADLELLTRVIEKTVADQGGALESWLARTSRELKKFYQRIVELGDVRLFTVGETPVTGGDVLNVLIILAVALVLSRIVRHAIRRVSESDYTGTQASLYTVGRLTHYAIIIFAVFIALSSIGLDFSNLALVAGALSVGIGFGLQSIVNNFVSGLIILFEHTLRVGDYIELDTGLTGTVKAINVRSTLINTNDNIDIVVPNSEFVTTRLTNWTLGERTLRVRIPFGVAYGSDKELVKKAALEAAAEVQYTLTHTKGREPDIWLVEYGDNSLNFLLLVWVNRQGAKRPTRTRAAYLWALETKLREYGIEIPFPQRDLHLRSGWPAQAVPGSADSEARQDAGDDDGGGADHGKSGRAEARVGLARRDT